jgi:hypothetical protein
VAAAAAAAVCVLGEDGEDVDIIKLGEDVRGVNDWRQVGSSEAAQLREELSGGDGGGRCVGGGWGGCYYCELGVMNGGGAEMMLCVACPKCFVSGM